MVVDCASTADAMRMLTLPAAFGMYLERAWPRHRRLSAAVEGVREAAMVVLVEGIASGVEELSALLTDGERVSAHLVLTAEKVVAAEAVRTLGSLALMGVKVAELIVNQVLAQDDSYEYRNLPAHPPSTGTPSGSPSSSPCSRTSARPSATCNSCWRRTWPVNPSGPRRWASCSTACAGVTAPRRRARCGRWWIGNRARPRCGLPDAARVAPGRVGALTLGRVDDDLIIGVAGMRRRVRLASVLRRCTVLDAALRGNELTVRFRPNPEVWPA